MANPKLPTILQVTNDLVSIHRAALREGHFNDEEDGDTIDVRLQVLANGSWYVHAGDASYDTNHNGFWGSGMIGRGDTRRDLAETAHDLLSQVREEM